MVGFDFSAEAIQVAKAPAPDPPPRRAPRRVAPGRRRGREAGLLWADAARAQDRARDAGVAGLCEFVVADALHLDRSAALRGRRFDTVLDCACLQCFSPNVQPAYLAQIAPLMARRARFLLFVRPRSTSRPSQGRGPPLLLHAHRVSRRARPPRPCATRAPGGWSPPGA